MALSSYQLVFKLNQSGFDQHMTVIISSWFLEHPVPYQDQWHEEIETKHEKNCIYLPTLCLLNFELVLIIISITNKHL